MFPVVDLRPMSSCQAAFPAPSLGWVFGSVLSIPFERPDLTYCRIYADIPRLKTALVECIGWVHWWGALVGCIGGVPQSGRELFWIALCFSWVVLGAS